MSQAENLLQLQTESIDRKVNMAVNTAIERVLTELIGLKQETHNLRDDMKDHFHRLDNRLVAVETKLGMATENQREIRNRALDYAFRLGWLVMGSLFTLVLMRLVH